MNGSLDPCYTDSNGPLATCCQSHFFIYFKAIMKMDRYTPSTLTHPTSIPNETTQHLQQISLWKRRRPSQHHCSDYPFHYCRADWIPGGVAVFYQYANGAAVVSSQWAESSADPGQGQSVCLPGDRPQHVRRPRGAPGESRPGMRPWGRGSPHQPILPPTVCSPPLRRLLWSCLNSSRHQWPSAGRRSFFSSPWAGCWCWRWRASTLELELLHCSSEGVLITSAKTRATLSAVSEFTARTFRLGYPKNHQDLLEVTFSTLQQQHCWAMADWQSSLLTASCLKIWNGHWHPEWSYQNQIGSYCSKLCVTHIEELTSKIL